MKKNYVLDWLEKVITTELNPETNKVQSVTTEHAAEIMNRIEAEEVETVIRLKNEIVNLKNKSKRNELVKMYHDALILLITKNYDNLHHPSTKRNDLIELHEFIGRRLQRMLLLFEQHLSNFLDNENRVPLTKLVTLKARIEKVAPGMKEKLSKGDYGEAPANIIMSVIDDFLLKIDQRQPVTIREEKYIIDLVDDVIAINGETTSITGCPVLNELLITWNLNSKLCIQYFTMGTEALMKTYASEEEQLAFLKLEYKKLKIIPEKENHVLDPNYPSVKDYCSRWLETEIGYRESKMEGFVPIAQETVKAVTKENAFKIVVAASVDQIGLFLRAADELRFLVGRSMSAIFKAIVPHLSTPSTDNPNWNRARSASYSAEERDKQAVIAMLEQMIKKIKEY